MAALRLDGRESNQMRPPHVELRPLLRADGSARFKFGNTVVLAAVYGPKEPKSRAREVFDRATLEVIVRPRVGIPGPAERQLESHLVRQLDHVVIHTEYPRMQISVVLQVASSDGSVAAAAGNAAYLALLDAGVAMRATALSVCVGVRCGDGPSQGAVLVLDPTEAEEGQCDAVVTLGVDGSRSQIVSSLSSGVPLDAAAWASCVSAGSKSCKVLEAFLRMSLQKRLETFLK
eukprot:TRINITY_DN97260_c0_g1_i1.p1 TRINITY_DN97260_c0_g1~~TRINITY_DN97260_c0_g1_i1.p1  ORF type:complete len:232 (-),score=53.30 TRINITY_DN97260_c0_g1_i1:32-727(-)